MLEALTISALCFGLEEEKIILMEWKGRIRTNCMQSLRFGLCEWTTASAKRAKTCQQNECKFKFCFFTIYYVYICSFSCFIWHTLNVMGLSLHCNACSHKMYVAQWYKIMNKVIVHWWFAVSWQMFLVIQPNKICYLTSISWFITVNPGRTIGTDFPANFMEQKNTGAIIQSFQSLAWGLTQLMWHRAFDMNACSVDNKMTLAPWQPSVDTADDQHTAFCWLRITTNYCAHTAKLLATQTLCSLDVPFVVRIHKIRIQKYLRDSSPKNSSCSQMKMTFSSDEHRDF